MKYSNLGLSKSESLIKCQKTSSMCQKPSLHVVLKSFFFLHLLVINRIHFNKSYGAVGGGGGEGGYNRMYFFANVF